MHPNYKLPGSRVGAVGNMGDGAVVQLRQECPGMTKFCKHGGHKDKCGVCIGKAVSMARATTAEEAQVATRAAAIGTGNSGHHRTAGTSQLQHGTVGCTVGNSIRSVRIPYLLGDIDIQLEHNSHGENLGLGLEGLRDGDLPSQQHILETPTAADHLRQKKGQPREPLRSPKHLRVVHMGPLKEKKRQ